MNPKTFSKKQNNYYNLFPEKRDFYFLDSDEKIKDFKATNFEDPEYICVIFETVDKKIKENIYKRSDFLNDYDFIKAIEKNSKISLNFIISKKKINIGDRETRLLTEIKSREKIMKEIERNTKINFNTNESVIFKESFSVPIELKFYNSIFTFYIHTLNLINVPNPTQLNNSINLNNNYNNISNNGFNNNTNITQFPNNNNNYGNFGYNNINMNNNINNHCTQDSQNTGTNNNNLINNNFNGNFNQNIFPYNNTNTNYSSNFQSDSSNNSNTFNNFNSMHEFNQYVVNNKNNNNNINNNNQNNRNGTNVHNFNNLYNPVQKNNSQNYHQSERNFVINGNSGQSPTQHNQNNSQNGTNLMQPSQSGAQPSQSGTGTQPPGTQNPGTQPPGTQNPGTQPPGTQPPGTKIPGAQPPKPPEPPEPIPPKPYIFSMKGLKNIGSTCYMNATLQCLLHVSELIVYFIDEYPKDQKFLLNANKYVPSGGNISREFYNLVIGVNDSLDYVKGKSNNLNPKTNKKSSNSFFSFFGFGDSYDDSSYDRAFAPKDFKRTLGIYNPQFQKFEANDSKDLILYLLQTMHDELNYYGNRNQRLNYVPNQYNIYETYNHFIANYNMNNFSKISLLFYGTYKNTTTCTICKKELYNFQKFEFISFGMYYYNRKKFNILDGFRDNSSPTMLKGDNKFLCNSCNKLQEAQTTCKIFEPPQKLLINIDYGKNKKYQPTAIEFSEEIDITEFVDFNFQQKIRYKIIGVCTHYGHSGSYGHYVAFCRNRENDKWYEFNDSFCSECNKREIYRGSPYLLLYERVFN